VIDRYAPELDSADVAPHFFAYMLDKEIPNIIFRSAEKKTVIKNLATL